MLGGMGPPQRAWVRMCLKLSGQWAVGKNCTLSFLYPFSVPSLTDHH